MFLFNGRQLISPDIVAVFQIASFAVIAGNITTLLIRRLKKHDQVSAYLV